MIDNRIAAEVVAITLTSSRERPKRRLQTTQMAKKTNVASVAQEIMICIDSVAPLPSYASWHHLLVFLILLDSDNLTFCKVSHVGQFSDAHK